MLRPRTTSPPTHPPPPHTPHCAAITATGVIWSRYSMVIRPKNWNLFAVNVFMAITGSYQLSRKIRADYVEKPAV